MGLEAKALNLSAAEGLHAAILGALARPVLAVGPAGEILYANAMAEEFFGLSESQLSRRKLAQLIPFASALGALVARLRETGGTHHEFGLDLGGPVSGERVTDVLCAQIPEWPGAAVLVFEPKSAAERMGRDPHRAAARQVSGMAAVLAHEIKNPLAGIKGAAQLIEAQIGEHDRPLAQLICVEADRVAKLIDRMTAFRGDCLEREAVNIHDVLDHVHRLAASGFARGIAISEDYDPSLPLVQGDRDALVQIFLNLVRNAAEAVENETAPAIRLATAFRPGVRITSPASGERLALPLEVSIIDNGPGVPPELMPHLFDPFVTTKPNGTGLGLALVAKLVDEHAGHIECRSRPGETIFRLRFPIAVDSRHD